MNIHLSDVIDDLNQTPPKKTIYIPQAEERLDHRTRVLLVPTGMGAPAGWKYLLELSIAQEVLEVWSAWRNGRTPSLEEACEAILYYAEHDAYQPEE